MSFRPSHLSVFSAAMLAFVSTTSLAQGSLSNSMIRKQINPPKKAQVEKKWSGKMGMVFSGSRYDSTVAQKSTTSFSVSGNLNYLPVSSIRFNFSPKFSYTNGYIQTQEATEASKSTWSVSNAGVDFMPNSYLTTSIGALDQSAAHNEIIFDSYAFPAISLNVSNLPDSDFVFGANAETAIVTSTNLSTEKKDFEKTPTFQSAGLVFKAQNYSVEGDLKANIFEFNNLPSAIATSASKVGNSTTQVGAGPRVFVYQYKGYVGSGKIKFNFNKYMALGFKGMWIQNSEAPKDMNQGAIGKVFFDANLSENLTVSPFYDYYRIEPDATVATLNDDRYTTNRVGYRTGLAFQFEKLVKISISGGERDVVYVNSPQERERTWNLRMETLNVEI